MVNNRDQWRVLVCEHDNEQMSFQMQKKTGNFLSSWAIISFSNVKLFR